MKICAQTKQQNSCPFSPSQCRRLVYRMATCAPTTFQDTKDRTWNSIFKLLKYLSGPEYMDTLLANFDFPSLLETLSKFLQEISRRLGLFALHNYLHEVVTPGIPDFPNWKESACFWVDVCVDKLKKICGYIYAKENLIKQTHMEELNQFLIYIIGKIERFFKRTVWKDYL